MRRTTFWIQWMIPWLDLPYQIERKASLPLMQKGSKIVDIDVPSNNPLYRPATSEPAFAVASLTTLLGSMNITSSSSVAGQQDLVPM
ncbi:hypothetical protein PAPYR_2576 [Paratrimastix pyriformis]|uniref:Uncharacterized protein n=1 Tax=Paratrimastix pyriformis TaxID=342808 RepID=A0ABQ8UQK5_9EUKA|nr:hypothetical protein PAPYR_2576 [Paratrimastix pyriformis]